MSDTDTAATHLSYFADTRRGSLLGRSSHTVLSERARLRNVEKAARAYVDAYTEHIAGDGDGEQVVLTFDELCWALRGGGS